MSKQQRNDMCACGSGKKYKNCCMRKDEARAQLSKQSFDVREVIGPKTTPYMFWKRWSTACSRNEFGLVYDMLLPGGELAQRFSSAEDFFANLNEIGLPFEDRWVLDVMRLSGSTVSFLCHRVDSDDNNADVVCSLMTMQITDMGLRVENIERKVCKRGDDFALVMDSFGTQTAFGALTKKIKSGWTRPDLGDESSKFVAPEE